MTETKTELTDEDATRAIVVIERLRRDMPRNGDVMRMCEILERIVQDRNWKFHLYRHYDLFDELLYVGISINAINRLGQHKNNAAWFSSIHRVTIEKFPTKEDALNAEQRAIKTEHPAHNVNGRVDATMPVDTTVATTAGCAECDRRRAAKTKAMKRWRAKPRKRINPLDAE
jgi:predicted GIY-YIG superfamily endonuclease